MWAHLGREMRTKLIKLSLGAVVEDVRTVFEKRNDMTVYIPDFF